MDHRKRRTHHPPSSAHLDDFLLIRAAEVLLCEEDVKLYERRIEAKQQETTQPTLPWYLAKRTKEVFAHARQLLEQTEVQLFSLYPRLLALAPSPLTSAIASIRVRSRLIRLSIDGTDLPNRVVVNSVEHSQQVTSHPGRIETKSD